MRIGIDVSPLEQPCATGVEKSLLGLLDALRQQSRDHRYYLVAPAPPRLLPELGDPRFRLSVIGSGRRRRWWRESVLPRFAHEARLDLWHSPVQAVPLLLDRPKVATLHELSWLETEDSGDEGARGKRRMHSYVVSRAADRIRCVSARTRDNFVRLHPHAARKCEVIPHSLDAGTFAAARRDGEFARRYGLPENAPYLLIVGRALERKGLPQSIRACRAFFEQPAGRHHRLAIAGPRNPRLAAALEEARAQGIADRVHALGYVAEEDLPALYARADACLVPSKSEGFGLPILEAMASGTPVVANDRAALPEVAGDAAVLTDFDQPAEAAAAIERAIGPERDAWVRRGLSRARSFPPASQAQRVLALWEETAA